MSGNRRSGVPACGLYSPTAQASVALRTDTLRISSNGAGFGTATAVQAEPSQRRNPLRWRCAPVEVTVASQAFDADTAPIAPEPPSLGGSGASSQSEPDQRAEVKPPMPSKPVTQTWAVPGMRATAAYVPPWKFGPE